MDKSAEFLENKVAVVSQVGYSGQIKIIEVDDFKKWLDWMYQLRVDDATGQSLLPRWLFRGQEDAEWGISSSLERIIGENLSESDDQEQELRALELRLISEAMSMQGLRETKNICDVALLQHMGIPTRLVDFSESPMVALYFAARNCDGFGKDFSVWAVSRFNKCFGEEDAHREPLDSNRHLDMSNVLATRVIFEECVPDGASPLICVYPPRMHPRMATQGGLFLMSARIGRSFMSSLTFGADICPVTRQLTPNGCQEEGHKISNEGFPVLGNSTVVKFVFKHTMRDRVMDYLRMVNVTGYSMMPDVGGVALALRERYSRIAKNMKWL